MGERTLLALLMVNSEAIVELRSAKSVSYMLLSTSLGTTGPLCLARLRGPVWLSQGLGVSHPGREHAEKWPDKHLSAGEKASGGWGGIAALSQSELSKVSHLRRMDCCVPDQDTVGIWGGTVLPCLVLS